jgi:hypothetical protein
MIKERNLLIQENNNLNIVDINNLDSRERPQEYFMKTGMAFIVILCMGIVLGCEAKKPPVQSSVQQSDLSAQPSVQEQKPVETIPWDEGFNVSWVGSYKSRATADYAVVFDLASDGAYKLTYGENVNIATTYSGKYNRSFNGGSSQSRLNQRITGLQVTNFDANSITLRSSWRLPSGNDTETYILYRQ